jgi:hypothetical protein
MSTIKIQFVQAFKDTCVVDQNSEFADICNPEGFIYAHMWFVKATTHRGDQFIHEHRFAKEDEGKAWRFAKRVQEKGEINPLYWGQTYPFYGSLAWEEEEADRQVRLRCALSSGNIEEVERYS